MTLTDHSSGIETSIWEEDEEIKANSRSDEDIVILVKIRQSETCDDFLFELYRGELPIPANRFRIETQGNLVQLTLKETKQDDAGFYSLVAKRITQNGGQNKFARRIHLRVDESSGFDESDLPIFVRRLSDLSVKVGTRTRFLVEIRSPATPKVTWHKNDEIIQANSRFSFVNEGNFYCVDVAPVMVDDEGHWTCMVENYCGRSSCSSHLTVIVPKAYKKPEFVGELRAILTETGTVSLECKVVGVPTPLLKWFKDNKEIKAGDVFALTANVDDPTSLGTYTCEATNCMGTAFSSSKVHVVGKGSREGSLRPADTLSPSGPLPVFKQILQDESCKIGESLCLSCKVDVPPWPKEITWYNKEGKVEAGERYHIQADGLGGYSIKINPVEAMDEGEWKCVATSFENMKQFTTCYVAMSIPKNYRKPRFMESLKAVLTEEGLVSFECKVVGFPTPLLQWFKDGQELKPGDVYQLTGANSLGSYCCIAKNCMGEAKSSAELTIEDIQNQLNEEERLQLLSTNQPPKFIRGLRSCEARICDHFRFTVQVSLAPAPSLFWYRDDSQIEENDKYRVEKESLGTCHLDVQQLNFVDQAEWKCVASNDYGHSVTSCFLKLIIPKHYKQPKFLENLRAILSEEGAVNLECKVIGVPQPTLKWFKDGAELKAGDIHRIISGQDGTCCLGTYTCEASNCMGSVSSSASLLGFEDRVVTSTGNVDVARPFSVFDHERELAHNLSLSTIHEERTSQLHDTIHTDQSVTVDDRGEVSFSFDGKEVSVSLYETPDLTEEEAIQIVEMYADQLSEHVTEHNIIELPPMRFMKETSNSGNLLMEAVVIDVSPEYFAEEGDDLRTEADMEDMSMMDEQGQSLSSPVSIGSRGDVSESDRPPVKPPRRKSSAKSDRMMIESESYHSAREPMRTSSADQKNSQKDSLEMDVDSEAFADALSSADSKLKKLEKNASSSLEIEDSSFDSATSGVRKTSAKKKRSLLEKASSEESSRDESKKMKRSDSADPVLIGKSNLDEESEKLLLSNKEMLLNMSQQLAQPALIIRNALVDFDSLLSLAETSDQEQNAFITENFVLPIQDLCSQISLIEAKALKGAGKRSLAQNVRIAVLEAISGPTEELLRGIEVMKRRGAENLKVDPVILEPLVDPVDEILAGLAKIEYDISGSSRNEKPIVLERMMRTISWLGHRIEQAEGSSLTLAKPLSMIHKTLETFVNKIPLNPMNGTWNENIDAVLIESLCRPLEDLTRTSADILEDVTIDPEVAKQIAEPFDELLTRLDALVVALEGYETDHRTEFVLALKSSLVGAAEELTTFTEKTTSPERTASFEESGTLPEVILDPLIDVQSSINSVLRVIDDPRSQEEINISQALGSSELIMSLTQLRQTLSNAAHTATTLIKEETINSLIDLREPLFDLQIALSSELLFEEIPIINSIIPPLNTLKKIFSTALDHVDEIQVANSISPIFQTLEEIQQQVPVIIEQLMMMRSHPLEISLKVDRRKELTEILESLQVASRLSTAFFDISSILEQQERKVGKTALNDSILITKLEEVRESLGTATVALGNLPIKMDLNDDDIIRELAHMSAPLINLQKELNKKHNSSEEEILKGLIQPIGQIKSVIECLAEDISKQEQVMLVLGLLGGIEETIRELQKKIIFESTIEETEETELNDSQLAEVEERREEPEKEDESINLDESELQNLNETKDFKTDQGAEILQVVQLKTEVSDHEEFEGFEKIGEAVELKEAIGLEEVGDLSEAKSIIPEVHRQEVLEESTTVTQLADTAKVAESPKVYAVAEETEISEFQEANVGNLPEAVQKIVDSSAKNEDALNELKESSDNQQTFIVEENENFKSTTNQIEVPNVNIAKIKDVSQFQETSNFEKTNQEMDKLTELEASELKKVQVSNEPKVFQMGDTDEVSKTEELESLEEDSASKQYANKIQEVTKTLQIAAEQTDHFDDSLLSSLKDNKDILNFKLQESEDSMKFESIAVADAPQVIQKEETNQVREMDQDSGLIDEYETKTDRGFCSEIASLQEAVDGSAVPLVLKMALDEDISSLSEEVIGMDQESKGQVQLTEVNEDLATVESSKSPELLKMGKVNVDQFEQVLIEESSAEIEGNNVNKETVDQVDSKDNKILTADDENRPQVLSMAQIEESAKLDERSAQLHPERMEDVEESTPALQIAEQKEIGSSQSLEDTISEKPEILQSPMISEAKMEDTSTELKELDEDKNKTSIAEEKREEDKLTAHAQVPDVYKIAESVAQSDQEAKSIEEMAFETEKLSETEVSENKEIYQVSDQPQVFQMENIDQLSRTDELKSIDEVSYSDQLALESVESPILQIGAEQTEQLKDSLAESLENTQIFEQLNLQESAEPGRIESVTVVDSPQILQKEEIKQVPEVDQTGIIDEIPLQKENVNIIEASSMQEAFEVTGGPLVLQLAAGEDISSLSEQVTSMTIETKDDSTLHEVIEQSALVTLDKPEVLQILKVEENDQNSEIDERSQSDDQLLEKSLEAGIASIEEIPEVLNLAEVEEMEQIAETSELLNLEKLNEPEKTVEMLETAKSEDLQIEKAIVEIKTSVEGTETKTNVKLKETPEEELKVSIPEVSEKETAEKEVREEEIEMKTKEQEINEKEVQVKEIKEETIEKEVREEEIETKTKQQEINEKEVKVDDDQKEVREKKLKPAEKESKESEEIKAELSKEQMQLRKELITKLSNNLNQVKQQITNIVEEFEQRPVTTPSLSVSQLATAIEMLRRTVTNISSAVSNSAAQISTSEIEPLSAQMMPNDQQLLAELMEMINPLMKLSESLSATQECSAPELGLLIKLNNPIENIKRNIVNLVKESLVTESDHDQMERSSAADTLAPMIQVLEAIEKEIPLALDEMKYRLEIVNVLQNVLRPLDVVRERINDLDTSAERTLETDVANILVGPTNYFTRILGDLVKKFEDSNHSDERVRNSVLKLHKLIEPLFEFHSTLSVVRSSRRSSIMETELLEKRKNVILRSIEGLNDALVEIIETVGTEKGNGNGDVDDLLDSLITLNAAMTSVQRHVCKAEYSRRASSVGTLQTRITSSLDQLLATITTLQEDLDQGTFDVVSNPLQTLQKQLQITQTQLHETSDQHVDEEAIVEGFIYPADRLLSSLNVLRQNQQNGKSQITTSSLGLLQSLQEAVLQFESSLSTFHTELMDDRESQQLSNVETLGAVLVPLKNIRETIGFIIKESGRDVEKLEKEVEQPKEAEEPKEEIKSVEDSKVDEDNDQKVKDDSEDQKAVPTVFTTVETIVDECIEISNLQTEALLEVARAIPKSEAEENQLTVVTEQTATLHDEEKAEVKIKGEKEEEKKVEVEKLIKLNEATIVESGDTSESSSSVQQLDRKESLVAFWSLMDGPLNALKESIATIIDEQINLEETKDIDEAKVETEKLLHSEIIQQLTDLQSSIVAIQQLTLSEEDRIEQVTWQEESFPALQNLAKALEQLGEHLPVMETQQSAEIEEVASSGVEEDTLTADKLKVLVEPLQELRESLALLVEDNVLLEQESESFLDELSPMKQEAVGKIVDEDLKMAEDKIQESILDSNRDQEKEETLNQNDKEEGKRMKEEENLRQQAEEKMKKETEERKKEEERLKQESDNKNKEEQDRLFEENKEIERKEEIEREAEKKKEEERLQSEKEERERQQEEERMKCEVEKKKEEERLRKEKEEKERKEEERVKCETEKMKKEEEEKERLRKEKEEEESKKEKERLEQEAENKQEKERLKKEKEEQERKEEEERMKREAEKKKEEEKEHLRKEKEEQERKEEERLKQEAENMKQEEDRLMKQKEEQKLKEEEEEKERVKMEAEKQKKEQECLRKEKDDQERKEKERLKQETENKKQEKERLKKEKEEEEHKEEEERVKREAEKKKEEERLREEREEEECKKEEERSKQEAENKKQEEERLKKETEERVMREAEKKMKEEEERLKKEKEEEERKLKEEERIKIEAEKKMKEEEEERLNKEKEEEERKRKEEERIKIVAEKKMKEEEEERLKKEKEEEEERIKIVAEKKMKEEEEERLKKEKEEKEEEERKRKEEEEERIKIEAEKKKKEDERIKKEKEEEEERIKIEAEKKKKEEEERLKKEKEEEEQKRKKEEAERIKIEAEKKKKEEDERLKKEKEEEEERIKIVAEKKKKKEEEKRLKKEKEEEERKRKEEEEKRIKIEDEKKKKEEEERLKKEKEEEERKRKENEEDRIKIEAEKKRREEEERLKKEKEEEEQKRKKEEEERIKIDTEKKRKEEEEEERLKKEKEEEEGRTKIEAEKKKKEEKEKEECLKKEKKEHERKLEEEEEERIKIEAEKKKKEEEECLKKEKEEEERKLKEEERLKLEAEQKKAEEERLRKEKEEQERKEEEERVKLEAEKKKKEEEQKRKEEAEYKKKEEEELLKKEKEEQERKQEEERLKKEKEEQGRKEAERIKREAEQKKKDDEERLKLEEELKKKEEERLKKEKEERECKEEEERVKCEAEKKKLEEEERNRKEEERLKLEAEEKVEQDRQKEEERIKKEAEKKKQEEERLKKEKEDQKREEEERVKLEAEKKKKEELKQKEEEERMKLEADAKKKEEERLKKEKEDQKREEEERAKLEAENKKKEEEELKRKDEEKLKLEAERLKSEAENKKQVENKEKSVKQDEDEAVPKDKSDVAKTVKTKRKVSLKKSKIEAENKIEKEPPKTENGEQNGSQEQIKPKTDDDHETPIPTAPEKSKKLRRRSKQLEQENEVVSSKKIEKSHTENGDSVKSEAKTVKSSTKETRRRSSIKSLSSADDSQDSGSRRLKIDTTQGSSDYKPKLSTDYQSDDSSSSNTLTFSQEYKADSVSTEKSRKEPERYSNIDSSCPDSSIRSTSNYLEYSATVSSRRSREDYSTPRAGFDISHQRNKSYDRERSRSTKYYESPISSSTSFLRPTERSIYLSPSVHYTRRRPGSISPSLIPEIDSSAYYLSTERSCTPEKSSIDRAKCPFFCTKLTNRTIAEGSRLRLTCTVIGQPDPEVHWTKNGEKLRPGSRERIKIENGLAMLEINSVLPEDSGCYVCVAKNSHGQSLSEAVVRVYAAFEAIPLPPTFTSSIKDTYRFADHELILECRVRGQPTPTVTWLKDDIVLRGNRYSQSFVGDGICRLKIANPDSSDSGEYVCRADNDLRTDQIRHVVHFEGHEQRFTSARERILFDDRNRTPCRETGRRPRISSYLMDHSVPVGGTIALQVEVGGTPAPNVMWLRRDNDRKERVLSSKFRTFTESGVHTLILPEASESEAGTYVCRAINAFGQTDAIANVEVLGPTKFDANGKPAMFISRPAEKTISAVVGEDVSVSFRVSGVPKPRVTWMKGIRDITNGPRSCKDNVDDYVRITLSRIIPSDEGTYCILAKNRYGCDRAFFSIKVKQRARSLTPTILGDTGNLLAEHENEPTPLHIKDVPGPISSEPIVLDCGRNWLSLSWGKAEQRGPAPIVGYKIEAWLLGGEGGARWAELGESPLNSFDAFNLRSGGEYKFRITPRNRYCWGESIVSAETFVVSDIVEIPEFVKILPGQLKVLEGSTVKLECEVRGDSKINWYRENNGIDPNNDPRCTVSHIGSKCSLILGQIKETDSGRYICEASNKAGKVSTFARVMVVNDEKILKADEKLKSRYSDGTTAESPPQFAMRLRDRRVQASYPFRLTCQVLGYPEAQVTWFKNGKEICQDGFHAFWNDESHFHTLEISSSSVEDSGCYMATAKNSYGSVSCRCVIVVDKGIRAYIAPEFTCGLDAAYTLKIGEELRMSAQIEAYPSVGVVWHRDGVRLRPSRRAVMTLNHDGAVELCLGNVTSRDAGVYSCTATNQVGRAETSTRVAILGTDDDSSHETGAITEPSSGIPYSQKPLFVTKPLSTDAVEGDTIIIMCEVVGDPKPEVMWLRDFLKPDYYRDATHFRRIGAGPQYRLEIPFAKLDFTGTYSVIAKNCHGKAKAIISLQIYAKGQGKGDRMDHQSSIREGKILSLPIIRKELRDIKCCDGDAVALECKFYAPTEKPIIRWEKDGKTLSLTGDFSADFDGESARLNIQHVYPEDEGEYTCIASNQLGKAFTSACLIVDVPEGKENVLSQPRLSKPMGLLSAGSTPRSTPRSTPVRSLSPAVAHGRELRAINLPRRVEAGINVRKKPKVAPPKFYTVPHNRVAEEGETIRFQCAITGHPTPWAVWDKNGVSVTPTPRIAIKEKDDLRVLEISQVTSEDAGLYRVTLENDVGHTEATARLEIINRHSAVPRPIRTRSASPRTYPTFTRSLLGCATRVNDSFQLQCDVRSSPSPTPSWYRNGKRIERSSRIRKHFDGRTARIEIFQVNKSDAGEYVCEAYNFLGSTRSSCQVIVFDPEDALTLDKEAPKFLQTLSKESIVMEGHSYELQTRITGTPPFEIKWLKDKKEVSDTDCYRYVVYEDGGVALRLANVNSFDAGEYTCLVRNAFGSSSCHGLFAVQDYKGGSKAAFWFTKTPVPVLASKGETVSFCARIQSERSIEIEWTVNGKSARENHRCKVEKDGPTTILRISSVTYRDCGEIRCTASVTGGRGPSISCATDLRFFRLPRSGDRSPSPVKMFLSPLPSRSTRVSSSSYRHENKENVNRISSNRRTDEKNTDFHHRSPVLRTDFLCAKSSSQNLENGEIVNENTIISHDISAKSLNNLRELCLEVETQKKTENEKGDKTCRNVGKKFGKRERKFEKEVTITEKERIRNGESKLGVEEIIKKEEDRLRKTEPKLRIDKAKNLPNEEIKREIKEVQRETNREIKSGKEHKTEKEKIKHDQNSQKITSKKSKMKQVKTKKEEINLQENPSHRENEKNSSKKDPKTGNEGKKNVNEEERMKDKPKCKEGNKTKNTRTAEKENLVEINRKNEKFTDPNESELIVVKPALETLEEVKRFFPTHESLDGEESEFLEAYERDEPAIVLKDPLDVIALRGSTAILSVSYRGHPEPTVRWLQAGRVLVPSEKIRIETGKGTSRLTLENVTADQAGKYAVFVENSSGRDCRYSSLAVEGPPESPAGVPIVSGCNVGKEIPGVNVAWCSPSYDGGCALTGYAIEMRHIDEDSWTLVSETYHSLNHTIAGLMPDETYIFRVKAINIHGASEPSFESVPFTVRRQIENETDMKDQMSDKESEEESFCEKNMEKTIVVPEDGKLFPERYDVMEELGKGRYGIVKRVVEKSTGREFASKFVKTIKAADKKLVREEIKIMNLLTHPKLLRLSAAFESPREIIMITEYISGGELFERVVADDFTLTEKDSILFMRQICEGVKYMHKNNVVHLDLKPENIMCRTRTSHSIKLIDFGLAQILKPNVPIRVLFGTPEFIPPEIISYEPIGTESDMWSVGIICYVLLSGLSPFMGNNDTETFANITRAEYDFDDEAFDAISQDAKDFIGCLLIKRKESRMSAKECLEHSWLAQHTENMSQVALSTEKLKKFLVRRKWQKTGNALRALGRMSKSANSRRSPSQSLASSPVLKESSSFESSPDEQNKSTRENSFEDTIEISTNDNKDSFRKEDTEVMPESEKISEKTEISSFDPEKSAELTSFTDEVLAEVSSLIAEAPKKVFSFAAKETENVSSFPTEATEHFSSASRYIEPNYENISITPNSEEIIEPEYEEIIPEEDRNISIIPAISDEAIEESNKKFKEVKHEEKNQELENIFDIEQEIEEIIEENSKIEENVGEEKWKHETGKIIEENDFKIEGNVDKENRKQEIEEIIEENNFKIEEIVDKEKSSKLTENEVIESHLKEAINEKQKYQVKFSIDIAKSDETECDSDFNLDQLNITKKTDDNQNKVISSKLELDGNEFCEDNDYKNGVCTNVCDPLHEDYGENTRIIKTSQGRNYLHTGNVIRTAKIFENKGTESHAGSSVKEKRKSTEKVPVSRTNTQRERIQKAFAFWNK